MLSELMTWWIRQMTDLLTMLLQRLGLKGIGAAVPDAVLLTPGSAGTRVERRRKGRIELLAAEADAAALQSLLVGRRRDRLVLLLPVSYTHLDVYKRQGSGSGAALPGGDRAQPAGCAGARRHP